MHLLTVSFYYKSLDRDVFKKQIFRSLEALNQSPGYITHRISVGTENHKFCIIEIYFSDPASLETFREKKYEGWNSFFKEHETHIKAFETSGEVSTIGADGCSG